MPERGLRPGPRTVDLQLEMSVILDVQDSSSAGRESPRIAGSQGVGSPLRSRTRVASRRRRERTVSPAEEYSPGTEGPDRHHPDMLPCAETASGRLNPISVSGSLPVRQRARPLARPTARQGRRWPRGAPWCAGPKRKNVGRDHFFLAFAAKHTIRRIKKIGRCRARDRDERG